MDPATWIYLALLAASTAASAQAQHKTNKARAKVQAEDTRRRKEQQAQAEAASQKTQEAYFDSKGKQAEREAELAQLYAAKEPAAPTTDAAGTHLADSTAAPTNSTVTIQGAQQEMAKGRARAAQRATSQAQIGAFGDVFAESGREAGRNAQDIGLAASKMQGWTQNVLPALYAKANVAGRDWATTSDILKLVSAIYAPTALGTGAAKGAGEVGAEQIAAARFGDAGRLAQGFGAGGTIPFGSAAGIDAGAALTSAGTIGSIGNTAGSLVGSEGLSRAMWKQLNGIELTAAERQALLMRQMAGGY